MDACFPPSPWHGGQSEHSVVIFYEAWKRFPAMWIKPHSRIAFSVCSFPVKVLAIDAVGCHYILSTGAHKILGFALSLFLNFISRFEFFESLENVKKRTLDIAVKNSRPFISQERKELGKVSLKISTTDRTELNTLGYSWNVAPVTDSQ